MGCQSQTESTSRDIEGSTEHSPKGQLEPQAPSTPPVTASTESSKWIVWYYECTRDAFMPVRFDTYSEAKELFDKWIAIREDVILTLDYHAT